MTDSDLTLFRCVVARTMFQGLLYASKNVRSRDQDTITEEFCRRILEESPELRVGVCILLAPRFCSTILILSSTFFRAFRTSRQSFRWLLDFTGRCLAKSSKPGWFTSREGRFSMRRPCRRGIRAVPPVPPTEMLKDV
jgi:hypothetical protein